MSERVTKEEWNKLWVAKVDDWTIGVTGDQHLLGQLILFPPEKVHGSIVHMSNTELLKFKQIGLLAEELLKDTFQSEWFNYNQAGNVIRDLHIHLQPRYSSPKDFAGYTFTDEGWGHPMKFRALEDLPDKSVVFKIVGILRDQIKTIKTDLKVEVFDY